LGQSELQMVCDRVDTQARTVHLGAYEVERLMAPKPVPAEAERGERGTLIVTLGRRHRGSASRNASPAWLTASEDDDCKNAAPDSEVPVPTDDRRSTDHEQGDVGSASSGPDDTEARSAASTPEVRRRFQRQRRKNTSPELAIRRELHTRGRRYRVDVAPLPRYRRRRADIVFARQKVAVFVDGCFWHRCPEHGTSPRANARWWDEKLQRNVDRDRDTDERLRDAGWGVVRIWEHEDAMAAVDRIEYVLRERD
jgi:DNA mismatch endonuclease, patch repair protein